MNALALVLAGLAGVVHVGFFVLEAVAFPRTASVQATFGARDAAAVDTLRVPLLNQGWYNLFLAAGMLAGVIGTAAGWTPQGPTLVVFCALFMVGAALVLVVSRPALLRGALVQGVLPLLALLAGALWR